MLDFFRAVLNSPTQFLPGCPWYDLHAKYPPNVDWCEEKLCSWIVTPNNTWTNLAYIFLGLYVWAKMRNSKSHLMRFFGPAVTIVGISSFIFHASLNQFTQVFDFFGMYTFCMLLIMFNRARADKWHPMPHAFRVFWAWVVGITAVTILSVLVHLPIQFYVVFLIYGIIYTEFKAEPPGHGEHRHYFWLTVITLGVAELLSILDLKRVLCNPTNHYFQGHGAWHVLAALALWFSFKHYRQFEEEIF
jgi:hypothetical protein